MSDRSFVKDLKKRDKGADKRLNNLETTEYNRIRMVHLTAAVITSQAIAAGVTFTSPDLRPFCSDFAQGVLINVYLEAIVDNPVFLQFSAGDDTPNVYSPQMRFLSPGVGPIDSLVSQTFWLPLGADGTIKVLNASGAASATITVTLNGWWE